MTEGEGSLGAAPILISFAPDQWSEVQKFSKFHSPTYNLGRLGFKALGAVQGHFQKAQIMRGLAYRLAPTLAEDREEMERQGYTLGIRSQELAGVVETVFDELYSTVDTTREALKPLYGNRRGYTSKSTRKLFKAAADGKLDERIPEEIRQALADAERDWVSDLREIRDEITHWDVGSCFMHDDGRISYSHGGLGTPAQAYGIDDVMDEIQKYETAVGDFLEVVFGTLNATLVDEETKQFCGIFNYRIYERFVAPREARDFNSGRCKSYEWFEDDDNPTCPLTDRCGAYAQILRLREEGRH